MTHQTGLEVIARWSDANTMTVMTDPRQGKRYRAASNRRERTRLVAQNRAGR